MLTALAFRRPICRLLIGVLVSTQVAIAAYACAGQSRVPMAEQGQPASAAMAMAEGAATNQVNGTAVGCGPLDPALPNLCLAHCQYGQQSADHSPAPNVPAVPLTSLYTLPLLADSSGTTGPASGPDGTPPVGAPPHAVLHCCLRL